MSAAKTAIRAAAVGQDFGADTAAFDPAAPVTEDVAQDKRGNLMREFESYERIIEGMKKAADGARHMARWSNPGLWNQLAAFLDQVRRAVVREAGFDRPQDKTDSVQQFGGEGLTWSQAQARIMTGLKDAEAGAKQIGMGQRKHLKWVRYAEQIHRMQDRATQMALASSPLKVATEWRQ